MSVISKIRERSGLAVTVVALGLILFLVGGDILGPNSILMGNRASKIGEINGEDVTAQDFQKQYKALEDDFQIQQQKSPSEQERQQMEEQAWNQIIFNRLYKDQMDKLGIEVTDEEKVDMVQGDNIHPAIKQAFTDPKTQQFDKAQIKNFLANFSKVEQRQQAAWLSFEAKLPDDRLRTKYEALLTKTDYVTNLQAEREYEASQTKAEVQYLFINYSTVQDSAVKVSDDDLSAYLKSHQYKYRVQDNRGVEYVQFMIQPNGEDSLAIKEELARLQSEFAKAQNDTQFAAANSDNPVKLQSLAANDLPGELSGQVSSLQAGQVYGPYLQGKTYTLYKVVGIGAEGEPVVKASHILFKASGTSDTAKAAAKARAQRVLNEIKGGADFGKMAAQYGSDGTAQQGGDLGWFDSKRMVKPFADAVFAHNGTGLLPNLVETEFGYHIVKVTEPKTNIKFKVVSIQKQITPGDKAENDVYAKATVFKQGATSAALFDTTAKKEKLTPVQAPTVFKSGQGVNDMQQARELIRWAYNEDTKIGDVSNIFELTDRYVVAKLTKKTAEGPAGLEDVRDALTNEVKKQKKAEQIIAKIGTGTFEQMRDKYGAGALVNTAPEIQLSTNAIMDLGYDPESVGKVFGSKQGAVIKPYAGENGVAALKVLKLTAAKPVEKGQDMASFKLQVQQRNQPRAQYNIGEALKEVGKVNDNRVRFY